MLWLRLQGILIVKYIKLHSSISEVADIFDNSLSIRSENAEDSDDEDDISEVSAIIKECRNLLQVEINS